MGKSNKGPVDYDPSLRLLLNPGRAPSWPWTGTPGMNASAGGFVMKWGITDFVSGVSVCGQEAERIRRSQGGRGRRCRRMAGGMARRHWICRQGQARGHVAKEYSALKGTTSPMGRGSTVMVWVYDKRPTNGSAFVYYGMVPVDVKSPEAQLLIKYTRGVLDALKLDNGPTHGEVMMTADGPCLVEMNCRSHGWDGAWVPLVRKIVGYAQPEVALDSHCNKAAFDKLPMEYCSPFMATGQTVMLVSFFAGTVRTTPGYDKMRRMKSFVSLQTGVGVGSRVEFTVDLFSAVGVLVLVHADKNQLEADLAEVRRMEKEGLFTYDEEVDPVQFEQSRDTIVAEGRRRTASDLSGIVLPTRRGITPAQLYATSALTLIVGLSAGFLVAKKMK